MLEQKKTSILLKSLHCAMREIATHGSDDRTIILHVRDHGNITIRHEDINYKHNFIQQENILVWLARILADDINTTFQPDDLLHLAVRPGQTLRFPFSSIHSYTLTGTASDRQMMA